MKDNAEGGGGCLDGIYINLDCTRYRMTNARVNIQLQVFSLTDSAQGDSWDSSDIPCHVQALLGAKGTSSISAAWTERRLA
jgi:hypothetical protein